MPLMGDSGTSIGGGSGGGGGSAGASSAAAKAWAASEAVIVGTQRTISVGGILTVLVSASARTTSATMDVAELAFWRYLGQNGTGAFPASTLVPLGFQIFSGGRLLESNVDHVSGAALNAAQLVNWFDQGPITYAAWTPSEDVRAGQVRRISVGTVDVYLMAKSSRTTGATLDATELAATNWSFTGQSLVGAFPATTLVPTGFSFQDATGVLWERTGAALTTGALFDAAASSGWSAESGDAVEDFVGSTYVRAGELKKATMLGITVFMVRLTSGDTAATLTAAELANWAYVGQTAPATYAASSAVLGGLRLIHGDKVYRRTATGTTPATAFDTDVAQWTLEATVESQVLSFVGSIYYPVGAMRATTVFGATAIIRCTVAHLAAATMTAAEAGNWEVFGGLPAAFAANTVVVAGQRLLTAGKLYRRSASGTSGATFLADIANWTLESTVGDSVVPAFAFNTLVLLGELKSITILGAVCTIRCTAQHTTAATFTLAEAGNWQMVGQAGFGTFAAANVVLGGLRIQQAGIEYVRNSTGTTGASFAADIAQWTGSGQSFTGVLAWAASSAVQLNELRTQTIMGATVLMRSGVAGTTAATFTAAEAANWTRLTQDLPGTFAATAVVLGGTIVSADGRDYRRNTTGTSGATLGADIANWTQIERGEAPAYAASTYYGVGALISQAVAAVNCTLRRTTAGISGATFDATEAGNWELVSQSAVPTTYPAAATLIIQRMKFFLNAALFERSAAAGVAGASFTADFANYQRISGGISGPDQTVTTAGAFTVSASNTTVFVNPAAPLATLVPTFPATPADRDQLRLVFGGTVASGNVVAAVTWPAVVLSPLPAALYAGDCVMLRYSSTISKWLAE